MRVWAKRFGPLLCFLGGLILVFCNHYFEGNPYDLYDGMGPYFLTLALMGVFLQIATRCRPGTVYWCIYFGMMIAYFMTPLLTDDVDLKNYHEYLIPDLVILLFFVFPALLGAWVASEVVKG